MERDEREHRYRTLVCIPRRQVLHSGTHWGHLGCVGGANNDDDDGGGGDDGDDGGDGSRFGQDGSPPGRPRRARGFRATQLIQRLTV